MQDLSQLKDIHLPQEVSHWPIAYGWWLSLILLVLVICAIAYLFIQQRKKTQVKRAALFQLNKQFDEYKSHQNSQLFLQQNNELLKRFCMQKYPAAINLSGKAWGQFLCTHAPKNTFNDEQLTALSQGLYQAEFRYDSEALFNACRQWLKNNKEALS